MNYSNLNLYHLKYFQDVVRLSSFSKAAEKNFITRPAISKAIKRLEEIVGYKLFEHEKKVVRVTKEGQLLADATGTILDHLMRTVMKPISGNQVIRLGVSYSIFKALFANELALYLSENEKNQLKVTFGTSRSLMNFLISDEIDFAIFLEDIKNPNFQSRKIHSGFFVLASPKLDGGINTLITTEDRHESLLVRRSTNKQFSRHIEIASWSACVDLIERKVGTGLIPDFLFNHKTMRRLNFKEKIPYTIWLVSRTKNDASTLLKILSKT